MFYYIRVTVFIGRQNHIYYLSLLSSVLFRALVSTNAARLLYRSKHNHKDNTQYNKNTSAWCEGEFDVFHTDKLR
jgi:hypothetical protein